MPQQNGQSSARGMSPGEDAATKAVPPAAETAHDTKLAAPNPIEVAPSIGITPIQGITVLSVMVLSPNGGEVLQAGTQVTITWFSNGAADHSVKYSIDGGANYIDIVDQLPASSRSYVWTVPAVMSTAARIRVAARSSAGNRVTDDSDGTFTIQLFAPAPVVTSVSPSSGPVNGGTPITVFGQNFRNGCSVKVGGSDAFNTTFIDATRVTAVTSQGVQGPATVRVVNPDGQGNGLVNAFTYVAVPTTVRVLSPNGGETLVPGQQATIAWQSSGAVSHSLKYTADGVNFLDIVNDLPATAMSYAWTVPQANTTTARVRVSIRDVAGNRVSDDSDGAFKIQSTAPGITSIMPASGSANGGQQVVITGMNFKPGCTVRFGSTDAQVLSVTATQVTVLTPPGAPGPVSVRLTNPDGQFVVAGNGYTYMAVPLTVKVLAPNGGETFLPGQQATITWQSSSAVSHSVKYAADGVNFLDVVNDLPGTAMSYAWTVPQTPTTTGRVRVSVRDAAGNRVTDDTDGFFKIQSAAPAITSIVPPSGSANGGQQVVITGMNFKQGCTVRFGSTDAQVLSVTATQVTVLTPPGAPGPVSVRLTNPDGQFVVAGNGYTYTVVQLTVKVLAPNGGEHFKVGATVPITWQSSGAASHRVQYALAGTTNFQPIATGLAGTAQSTSWTIPSSVVPANQSSANVVIRVVARDAGGVEVSDTSDGAVVIEVPAPTVRPTVEEGQRGGKLPTMEKAAGEPAVFAFEFVDQPNVALCQKVVLVPEGTIPNTISASVVPKLNSTACGVGVIQMCQGTGLPAGCGEYSDVFTTQVDTPAGDYIYSEFFDTNFDGTPDEPVRYTDGTPARVRLRIRQPKIEVIALDGPMEVMAGNPATFRFKVKRSGFLGTFNLDVTSDPPKLADASFIVLSKTSFSPTDGLPDGSEIITLTVTTVRPAGGLTPGTPKGSYTLTVTPSSMIGVPIDFTPATAKLTVTIKPDLDITIEQKKPGGNDDDMLPDHTPIPAAAGTPVDFIVKIFRYNITDEPPLDIVIDPPFGTVSAKKRMDPKPLDNGNGDRIPYLLTVMVNADAPPMRFAVTAQTSFNNGNEIKMPSDTAYIKVLSQGVLQLSLNSSPSVEAAKLRCATYDFLVTASDVTDTLMFEARDLDPNVTATFNPATVKVAPDKPPRSVQLTLNARETAGIVDYSCNVVARRMSVPSVSSNVVPCTLRVTRPPFVKVKPSGSNPTQYTAFAGSTLTVSLELDRGAAGGCKQFFMGDVTLENIGGVPVGFQAPTFETNPIGPGVGTTLSIPVPADAVEKVYEYEIGGSAVGADVDSQKLQINVLRAGVIVSNPTFNTQARGLETIMVEWITISPVVIGAHTVTAKVGGLTAMLTTQGGVSGQSMNVMIKLPNPVLAMEMASVEVLALDVNGGRIGSTVVVFPIQRTDAATITDFMPDRGAANDSITITGTNFVAGETQFFFFDGVNAIPSLAAQVNVTGPTMLTAIVPKRAFTGVLRALNPSVPVTRLEDGLSAAPFTVVSTVRQPVR